MAFNWLTVLPDVLPCILAGFDSCLLHSVVRLRDLLMTPTPGFGSKHTLDRGQHLGGWKRWSWSLWYLFCHVDWDFARTLKTYICLPRGVEEKGDILWYDNIFPSAHESRQWWSGDICDCYSVYCMPWHVTMAVFPPYFRSGLLMTRLTCIKIWYLWVYIDWGAVDSLLFYFACSLHLVGEGVCYFNMARPACQKCFWSSGPCEENMHDSGIIVITLCKALFSPQSISLYSEEP